MIPARCQRRSASFAAERLLVALVLLTAGACKSSTGNEPDARVLSILGTRYVLTPAESSLTGFAVTVNGSLEADVGSGRFPASSEAGRWSVSSPSVITVTPGGYLRAGSAGSSSLSVEVTGLRDTASVFVAADLASVSASAERVIVGAQHACMETLGGSVYCWGGTSKGQLGTGFVRRFTATLSPVRIAFDRPLHALDVGATHSCALTSEGSAVCWGDNSWQQVSPASSANVVPTPTAVAPGLAFTAIGAGGDNTCAITIAGAAYCWGRRFQGIQRLTGPPFVAISAGFMHACALDAEGKAYCWGLNGGGELGTGATGEVAQPTPVSTDQRFLQIDAGTGHTCGVTVGQFAYCWGSGPLGLPGPGLGGFSSVPVPVALNSAVLQIGAGRSHSCAIALTGLAFCWGQNLRGQLGVGPPTQSQPTAADFVFPTPVPIATPMRFRQISAGSAETSCGIAIDGSVLCWGNHGNGTAGTGRQLPDDRFNLSVYWEPTAVRWIR